MAKAKTKTKELSVTAGTHVKRLWAATHHSPVQVLDFCNTLSERNFDGMLRSQIIMPDDVRMSSYDDTAHIWICVSAVTLELLKQKRIDMSKATIIIVDNVVQATQYKGIKLLDCKQPRSYKFQFIPLDSELVLNLRNSVDEGLIEIDSVKVDILPALLNAQPPSILHPVMTFGYKIPDTDKRTRYIVDIFRCIQAQESITTLDWFKHESKPMSALNDWFESPIGRKACIDISNALNKVKPTDGEKEFKELADEFGVAKFDINYAVIFIKRTSVSVDEETVEEMFRKGSEEIQNRQLETEEI